MKQLDEQLDVKPTEHAVAELAESRIQNILAFRELQQYNDTGDFLYQHPLIVHRSERAELIRLMKQDPNEFIRRYKCCTDNIRRYESFLKREDRIEKREADKANLSRHKNRESIFKSLIQNQ